MKNVSVRHYKTARCILFAGDRFLLAIHHHARPISRGKWGLPGGHTEAGEEPEDTVRRELTEELKIDVGDLYKIGDYPHNDRWHRVYGARYYGDIRAFDSKEIQEIAWYSRDQVFDLHAGQQLHAGWEYAAICELEKILSAGEPAGSACRATY